MSFTVKVAFPIFPAKYMPGSSGVTGVGLYAGFYHGGGSARPEGHTVRTKGPKLGVVLGQGTSSHHSPPAMACMGSIESSPMGSGD